MRQILLIYVFLLFWSIFGEIHRELFFLDIKMTSQKRALKYSESSFLSPCLKGANTEENLDLFKNYLWSNQWKGIITNKNCFSQQGEPHIAKNIPSCCFEVFWGKFIENFPFNINVTITEKSTEIFSQFFFLTIFENGANPEENLDLFKQLFLNKPVIEDKY